MVDAVRLKKSWAQVAAYGDQVPLFFYSTLFLEHPHVREMFPVSMANQRDKLVAALGRVVSSVDDLDAVVPVLQHLGRDHRKFAVVRDHYPAVGQALLATLEHFSGADWTPELAQDWAAAYGIVADVMTQAADAVADQPPWWATPSSRPSYSDGPPSTCDSSSTWWRLTASTSAPVKYGASSSSARTRA